MEKIKNVYTVFGRTIDLPGGLVKDYNAAVKTPLSDQKIELILKSLRLDACAKYADDKSLKYIIARELCIDAYTPNMYIEIFNGTRILRLPRYLTTDFAILRGLRSDILESFLLLDRPKEELDKLSDDELNNLMMSIIKEEIELATEMPNILKKIQRIDPYMQDITCD